MKIIDAHITVTNSDRAECLDMIGCHIHCDFPLFKEDYIPPKLFEFRGVFDDKSEDFKLVFKDTNMTGCIINGTDCTKRKVL